MLPAKAIGITLSVICLVVARLYAARDLLCAKPFPTRAHVLNLLAIRGAVIGKGILPMGHFQLFSIILTFSVGHFLSFYTDFDGPFSKIMGLWRMVPCLGEVKVCRE